MNCEFQEEVMCSVKTFAITKKEKITCSVYKQVKFGRGCGNQKSVKLSQFWGKLINVEKNFKAYVLRAMSHFFLPLKLLHST